MNLIFLVLIFIPLINGKGQKGVSPDPKKCAERVKHQTWRDPRGVTHSYFYSWEHGPTQDLKLDAPSAYNYCRERCQDLVSIETPLENEMVKQHISRGRDIRYIWTSGRKVDGDLVNGWYWGSGAKIGATNVKNNGDWSQTGGNGRPQPDNRGFAQLGEDEPCLAVFNNFYNDGIKWHDVACHYKKPFICEDSDSLLNILRSRYPLSQF